MTELFRRQAMARRSERLQGEVLLLPRTSHTLLIFALLLWLLFTLAWLASSHYARKETVLGWLEPDTGVLRVYAQRGGIIDEVMVSEGEEVSEGQPLVVVNGDRVLADGQNLDTLLLEEYAGQRALLEKQLQREGLILAQKRRDLRQRIDTTAESIDTLEAQSRTLDRRRQLTGEKVARYTRLAREGHISSAELDMASSEQLRLDGEQQALARERGGLQNQLQQLENRLVMLPEEAANAGAELRARLSDLSQRIAQLHGQQAYTLKAPRAGVVNNLQAREGQQAKSDVPLLTLSPANSPLTARLLVPVRAAGFLDTGQQLNIRYDAFPYQKFGLYRGEIVEVSKTVLLPEELHMAPVAVREPTYRISALPDASSVQAFGQTFALRPGMTLSADVRLAERSILEWLLEPLYSLRGRL